MKNTFEVIANTFHSVRFFVYLFVIIALLALTITTVSAQSKCPIEQGLYKSNSISHIYDGRTQTYTKIYTTDLGTVTLVMDSVSVSSYKLHRYSHTIPTNIRHYITVKWNGKLKRFSHTEILKSTKQL
jgi:hypothetical protein